MKNASLPTTPLDRITVIGESAVSQIPDLVVLTVGVESSGASAVQALAETNHRVLRVVQALVNKGVRQSDIQSTWVGVYPFRPFYSQNGQLPGLEPAMSQHSGPGGSSENNACAFPGNLYASVQGAAVASAVPGTHSREFVRPYSETCGTSAFVAGNWLGISVRDPKQTGEILDAALAAGAAYCCGQSLRFQDESAVRRRAVEAAGKDARAKAEILAAAAGCQLGKPICIEEEFSPQGSPVLGSHASPQVGGPATGSNANGLPLGREVYMTSRVRITYELK